MLEIYKSKLDKKNLTVHDIAKIKIQIENDLFKLVTYFEKNTGVIISEIGFKLSVDSEVVNGIELSCMIGELEIEQKLELNNYN